MSNPLARYGMLLLFASISLTLAFTVQKPDEVSGRGAQSSGIDFEPVLGLLSFQQQPPLATIGSDDAHDLANGAGQRIAIIDGGFDLLQESIDPARVMDGHDFVDDDSTLGEVADGIDQDLEDGPDSMLGHGTAVASLITELAPEASLLLYRAMDEEGVALASDVAQAILRAVLMNASVIYVGAVFQDDDATLASAVEIATAAGVAVVAPSGNHGGVNAAYPGAYENVICVSGTTRGDKPVTGQANGPAVDILAPGEDVVVALLDDPDGYGVAAGSSYAAAIVAGAVALVREVGMATTPAEITERLRETAVDIGLSSNELGAGECGLRLDVHAAVK